MLEESSKKSEWSQREIGAFWTKESSKGKYLSGTIEIDELGQKRKVRVVMFPNRHKDNDKKPDYILYESKDKPSSEDKKDDIPKSL